MVQNVVRHCDLLCANVILPARDPAAEHADSVNDEVHFIDHEYAVPCPAAFDLANHFSEWGGFECDYNLLSTRKTRRILIEEYAQTYHEHCSMKVPDVEQLVDGLCRDVDRYRGMPGFYRGVQALIEDNISDVQFDWASYADLRFGRILGMASRGRERSCPIRRRNHCERAKMGTSRISSCTVTVFYW